MPDALIFSIMTDITTWSLVIITSFIGAALLFFVWRSLRPLSNPEARLLGRVRRYFGFLLDRGYKLGNLRYYSHKSVTWTCTFQSELCIIRLGDDGRGLVVSIAPNQAELADHFSLGALIFYITGEQEFIRFPTKSDTRGQEKQLKQTAKLLAKYHDQIVSCLDDGSNGGSPFGKYRDQLIAAQTRYNNILMNHP